MLTIDSFTPDTLPAAEDQVTLTWRGRRILVEDWVSDSASGREFLDPDTRESIENWIVDQDGSDEFHETLDRILDVLRSRFAELWAERVAPIVEEITAEAVSAASVVASS